MHEGGWVFWASRGYVFFGVVVWVHEGGGLWVVFLLVIYKLKTHTPHITFMRTPAHVLMCAYKPAHW